MPSIKPPALAYIDGGLAAFLAQAAVAGFLGALWVLKGYWYSIKAFFGGGGSEEVSNLPQGDQDE